MSLKENVFEEYFSLRPPLHILDNLSMIDFANIGDDVSKEPLTKELFLPQSSRVRQKVRWEVSRRQTSVADKVHNFLLQSDSDLILHHSIIIFLIDHADL